MEHYRKPAHYTYDIKYHIVWITKYRKPVIIGAIAERIRELIRGICQINEVEILAGHVGSDYIHVLVSVPPHLSARGYFLASSGNVTDGIIREYIKNEDMEEKMKSDNFDIGQLDK